MLPNTELFIALAQVCVLLAGFASVVMALRQRSANWTENERVRLTNLLTLCLAGALFSLAPQFLHAMGIKTARSLLLSQLFMATVISLILATRFVPTLSNARESRGNLGMFVVLTTMFAIATTLQVLSAAQVAAFPAGGTYMAGVLIVVIACGVNFFRLVMHQPES